MQTLTQPRTTLTRRTLTSLVVSAMVSVSSGCANNAVTPSTSSLSGQWLGTTAQGQPISFTVSSDEAVTAITLGHAFAGCIGTETFANLSLSTRPKMLCSPSPCPATVTNFREFGDMFGNVATGPSTQVTGLFLPGGGAQGTANFRDFGQCGSAIGVSWSATKR